MDARRRELLRRMLGQAPAPDRPPIEPGDPSAPAPLSFAQQRLWFLEQMAPGDPALRCVAAARLRGPLDRAALAGALDEIVRRHAILRTTFSAGEDGPRQRALPHAPHPLEFVDETGAGEARLIAGLVDAAEAPLDLEHGPPYRVQLVRLAPELHVLALMAHHLVWDGWSTAILFRELSAAYAALATGRAWPLPPLPFQYADWAAWERRRFTGEAAQDGLRFWRDHLRGAPPRVNLPTDAPRTTVATARGTRLPVHLPEPLVTSLKAVAREAHATPFMVVAGALAVLVGRYAGSDDVVLGCPVVDRPHPATRGLLGLFLNTLPLRFELAGTTDFLGLLARIRPGVLGGLAHAEIPVERIVEELGPRRSATDASLFEVLLSFDTTEPPRFDLPGLEVEPFSLPLRAVPGELGLSLAERDGALVGRLEYRDGVLSAAGARLFAAQLETLLAGIAADPRRPLDDHLRGASAGARAPAPDFAAAPPPPVAAVIRDRVAEAPGASALRWGDHRASRAALLGAVQALAARLRAAGVAGEAAVAVALPRSPTLAAAILALLDTGGVFVPIDLDQPAARLERILAESRARVAIVDAAAADRLPSTELLRIAVDPFALEPAPAGTPGPPRPPPPADHLAYIVFTSGSTGMPKGVCLERGGLAHLIAACRETFAFRPDDVCAWIAAPTFDISLFEVLNPLAAGGAVRIVDAAVVRDPDRLLEELRDCTVFHAVPSLMRAIVDALDRAGRRGTLPALRAVFIGGEKVAPELVARMAAAWPAARIHVLYGPSEATIICASHAVSPGGLERPSIGRALPGVELEVRDAAGRPVPDGVPGELWILGPLVGRGYTSGVAGEAAGRFIEERAGDRTVRALRTGDRVRRLDDGMHEFLGRVDEQEKIRGVRVEPGEIEAALAAHPGVADTCVAGVDDGHGGRRLAAWIVSRAAPVPPDELRRFLAERLPALMVPATFTAVDTLPRNANGKLDRARLPPPVEAEAEVSPEGAPGTLDELACTVFAAVLGHPVGPGDDFFIHGGHSLRALELAAAAGATFGLEVPLARLFADPTPAGLARAVLELRGRPAGEPLVRVPRGGALPVTPQQADLVALARVLSAAPLFVISAACELAGPLDEGRLRAALVRLVDRHEALRTVFPLTAGEPEARLLPSAAPPLTFVELDALEPEAQTTALVRLSDEDRRQRFDLEHGPLVRATLVRLGPARHALLLGLHHAVCDELSIGILYRDLAACYAAPDEALPAVLQAADFAAWQRRTATPARVCAEVAFWRDRLGAPESPLLAAGGAGDDAPTFIAARAVAIAPRLTDEAFGRLAAGLRGTPYVVALAALAAVLQPLRRGPVRIGTLYANRDRHDLRGVVGLLTNTLVLALPAAPTSMFGEHVAATRAAFVEALAHAELPFEALARGLADAAGAAEPPALFRVMLTFRTTRSTVLPAGPVTLRPLAAWPQALDPEFVPIAHDLVFDVHCAPEGTAFSLLYKPRRMPPADAEHLLAGFRAFVELGLADPARSLGELLDAARQVAP